MSRPLVEPPAAATQSHPVRAVREKARASSRQLTRLLSQVVDTLPDVFAQLRRTSPIIEDAAASAVVPTYHEHACAERLFQVCRQPPNKAAVVETVGEVETKDTEQFLSWAFGWKELRSKDHTPELQQQPNIECRLLLEKKNKHVHSTAAAD